MFKFPRTADFERPKKSKEEIRNEVWVIICRKLGCSNKSPINKSLRDLGSDSLDIVELDMEICEHFMMPSDTFRFTEDMIAEKLMDEVVAKYE